ncbi:MAG: UvrD-helicase domain-containing protein [Acidimicrobiia bacterium]|nr:UvrD-helicase domain-containing protein [Acidimicrobiia bacterium]
MPGPETDLTPATAAVAPDHDGDELLLERARLAEIEKAHQAYLDQTRRVASQLASEATEAMEDGIRDIVDEDAEADAAVQAVLVRQISERAMYAARRVADLEAQGEALAFGRMTSEDGNEFYVGRRTVFDGDDPLLIDWRARAAVPFYRAAPLEPMGFRQRRHLIYQDGASGRELVDYSDEVFDVERLSDPATAADGLRGEAALLASLVAPTVGQMRSVVATIQAEQDAVIRAPGHRMLVVQGGPGTGKTVVALHRAAYLLYDQRVELADTGVLIVGPSQQFLHYISGVLPSLGESGVVSITVPRLYRGARLGWSDATEVSELKASAEMAGLLRAAVALRRRRPDERFITWYGSRRVVLDVDRVQAIFDRSRRHLLHNDGAAWFRSEIIDTLVHEVYDPAFHNLDDARESFETSDEVVELTLRHFPSLTPEQALNDLLGSVPLLRSAARAAGLDPDRLERLHRPRTPEAELDRRRWSDADAALLDELLSLVGPPATKAIRPPDGGSERSSDVVDGEEPVDPLFHRHEADEFELADRRDTLPLPSIDPFERPDDGDDEPGVPTYNDPYYDDESDVDGDGTGHDGPPVSAMEAIEELAAAEAAAEEAFTTDGRPAPEYDGAPAEDLQLEAVDSVAEESATIVELVEAELSWRFGHVIVDEAQDLTPMQWRMVARRSSGGALTVVGDLAQRVGSPVASWADLIPDQLPRFDVRELTVNYRSPAENDDVTGDVLAAISPDLTLARSLRRSGFDPLVVRTDRPVAEALLRAADELRRGAALRVAIITVDIDAQEAAVADDGLSGELGERLVVLTPAEAKGLEFDSVLVVEPASIASQPHGLNLLYVAVTRPTQRLIVIHRDPLPEPLARALRP